MHGLHLCGASNDRSKQVVWSTIRMRRVAPRVATWCAIFFVNNEGAFVGIGKELQMTLKKGARAQFCMRVVKFVCFCSDAISAAFGRIISRGFCVDECSKEKPIFYMKKCQQAQVTCNGVWTDRVRSQILSCQDGIRIPRLGNDPGCRCIPGNGNGIPMYPKTASSCCSSRTTMVPSWFGD